MASALSPATLLQIDCFVRVVEAGSFAAAARRLGMTTSAVSKTITRFETLHGVRLLHRSTHSLSPTAEGEVLLDAAREILSGLDRLETAIARAKVSGEEGRVRLSAPPGFFRVCLLPALPALTDAHPEIQLDVRINYRHVDLAEEGVDLALRGGAVAGLPGHVVQRLFSFGWRAYASPDYVARRGAPRTPAELGDHDLVGFRGEGRVAPWRFRHPVTGAATTALHRDGEARIVFEDGPSAYDWARGGRGIVWAPEWLAWDDLRERRIVEVLDDWRSRDVIAMSVLRRSRQLPRRTRIVLDFLRECAKGWGGHS